MKSHVTPKRKKKVNRGFGFYFCFSKTSFVISFFYFADWLCITHRKQWVTQAFVGTKLLALLHARAHTSCDDKKHHGSHLTDHGSLRLGKNKPPSHVVHFTGRGKAPFAVHKTVNNQFVSLAIKLRSRKCFGLNWVETLFLSRFP